MYVVTGDEMRQIDRYTMESIGLKEETLMESAGQSFCRQLIPTLGKNERIVVLIGTGNNGGDGFVIGRLLQDAGYETDVWVIPPEEKIHGTAKTHKLIYERSGYQWVSYAAGAAHRLEKQLRQATVIIDALLGTGLIGKPRSPYREVIDIVNAAKGRIISVDIPSGIPSKEGNDADIAGVKADETYSFQAPKLSAFRYPEAGYYGKLRVLDIGIPAKAFRDLSIVRKVIAEDGVRDTLPNRAPNAHKGSVGKALIIGGSRTMTGAPVLSTNACLRAGAGLITLAVPEEIQSIVSVKTTEATFFPIESDNGSWELDTFAEAFPLHGFQSIAIGPGLGRAQSHHYFSVFDQYEGSLVIDADGLYYLSRELAEWTNGRKGGPTIITPHPGEMAALTGKTIAEVEKNRFAISKQFACAYRMYVVLKGPYTIITTPEGVQWVNTTGKPSLAKGGSGDVLTGIITAFLLQHRCVSEALCNAVHIHGKLADKLAETHDIISVTASDLVESLPVVLRSYRYRSY
ncbi:NAD(P)H-hydrate epimerase [Evansella caseinilytica]|uniref:Bifunctional NAD(P)H-hydrate repair enzyme n=1 Tax=Evansella caseinilytica TaxID=1503961 RepID=A0A1H3QHQ1_9BACI|nr:NAD(P)H-hydrate dehydratase [Evansella caseinilytica]SDZ13114.1 NAD(P)H-hydrate epimerase [Evansella caseinilytica]